MAAVESFLQGLGSNVVYSLLMLGIWLAITAVYNPGMGFPEAGAALSLLLAGAGMLVLGARVVGVLLLAAGMAVVLAQLIFRDKRGLALVGIALMVLGSLWLFRRGAGPGLWVVLLVNAAALAYYRVILEPGLSIQSRAGMLGGNQLIGQTGVVLATLDPTGSIRLQGEVWSATADTLVEAGRIVRVVGRDGLSLHVVPTDPVRGAPVRGEPASREPGARV